MVKDYTNEYGVCSVYFCIIESFSVAQCVLFFFTKNVRNVLVFFYLSKFDLDK